MGHRILVVAHAHPDFSRGGGERAAYTLFQGYRERPEVEAAWFLARVDLGNGPTGRLHLRRDDEYLWEQSVDDFFNYAATNRASILQVFHQLVETLNPTIIHLHHFVHIGLDYIQYVRTHFPHIKIFMTPHEYTLICANSGQMVKTGSLSLCNAWGLLDCHQCFPDKSPEAFWLRYRRLRSYMDCIDHFFVPSRFLRDRLVAWGLPAERTSVIENGLPLAGMGLDVDAPEPDRRTRNRFGYFGQVNRYKGLDVLLAGAKRALDDGHTDFVIEVNGAYLERQEPDLQKKIARLRVPLEDAGVLDWVGPYELWELGARMRSVDWVLVPSIWWENSPVVIQEAFAYRRPVVCSGIGGMAEKVRDDIDGVHVPVGDERAWADTIGRLAGANEEWIRLRANIARPIDGTECAARHLAVIARLARGLQGEERRVPVRATG